MSRFPFTTAVVGLLAFTLMACSAQTVPGSAAPSAEGASASTPSASAPSDPDRVPGVDGVDGPAEPGMDACRFVPDTTITKLIGNNSGGQLEPHGSLIGTTTDCTWKNTTTQGIVLVIIGVPGSAPGGALRPPAADVQEYYSALDDGMRLFGTDKVEFVAGDRACAVRVSSDPLNPNTAEDRAAATTLAKSIRGEL